MSFFVSNFPKNVTSLCSSFWREKRRLPRCLTSPCLQGDRWNPVFWISGNVNFQFFRRRFPLYGIDLYICFWDQCSPALLLLWAYVSHVSGLTPNKLGWDLGSVVHHMSGMLCVLSFCCLLWASIVYSELLLSVVGFSCLFWAHCWLLWAYDRNVSGMTPNKLEWDLGSVVHNVSGLLCVLSFCCLLWASILYSEHLLSVVSFSCQCASEWVSQPFRQAFCQSVMQSVHQSVTKSVSQFVYQAGSLSISQFIGHNFLKHEKFSFRLRRIPGFVLYKKLGPQRWG